MSFRNRVRNRGNISISAVHVIESRNSEVWLQECQGQMSRGQVLAGIWASGVGKEKKEDFKRVWEKL